MYAVRVLPIVRGPQRVELSFFSRCSIEPGSIVSAPVRGRMLTALVTACADVREEKLELKASDFALKKLGRAQPRQVLSDAFMRAAERTAAYHVAPLGAAIAALTFSSILSARRSTVPEQTKERASTAPEFLVLQAEPAERIRTYRNIVRECFAQNGSLIIMTPSIVEAEHLGEQLARGIEEQVVVLTSAHTRAALQSAWERSSNAEGPVVVIGTPAALSAPLKRLHTIVVERESARAYRGREWPHLDARRAAQFLAYESGARLILADFPLSVDALYRAERGEAEHLARPQLRLTTTAQTTILDTRAKDTVQKSKRHFTPLAETSLDALRDALGRKARAVVFAARRGIAPLTVCNDCGTPVTDPSTGAPMALHKSPSGNIFVSHRSGAVLPASTVCRTCGGWNLVSLGIGVDRVTDFVANQISDAQLYTLTKDSAETHARARKIASAFYTSEGGVLVGTERMLPYLTEQVDLVVVASIDSILSSSAWRANEHAHSILWYLKARAERSCIIETRMPEHGAIAAFAGGNPMDLYRAESELRQEFGYPPHTVFISLLWTGTEATNARLRLHITESFSDQDLVGPLPPIATDRGRCIERVVLRIPAAHWPESGLAERLRALPPEVAVEIDPDTIA